MRVSEIEVHQIQPRYQDFLAYALGHYYGPSERTVYVVHTDTGLVGLGEGHEPESEETLARYRGSNPFDWVGDETSLALGTAMYDLMGQAAGVPVYKLFGQRQRAWVPVGAWTVSTSPERMAEAVRQYAGLGYTWMKFHLSPFENVIAQTEAMQAVAPAGFKVHYDFTMHGTDDYMPELLDKLAEYPIAGCFEDLLPGEDIAGYVELRQRAKRPIVLHHFPMGATYEILQRPADIYMLGHYVIGDAVRRAGLFDAAGSPFMVQNVGGEITRAMSMHMTAAFPTATFPIISTAETWKDDVVCERPPIVNGFVRVPEKPGLGLSLDREALARLAAQKLPEQPRWIIRSSFKNGARMFLMADTANPLFMVRPDRSRLLPMRYDAPIETEYWDDDGSAKYRGIFARIEREGMVLER
ncbi:MAG: mandelate racemase/muconate lactonizing enzyme family protein [Candidatus Latescibacterota bacterium]|jgi:gluconate/galactonate dehydratase